MPIVTERFDLEKYAHVDALLANFQGVFLNDVRLKKFDIALKVIVTIKNTTFRRACPFASQRGAQFLLHMNQH